MPESSINTLYYYCYVSVLVLLGLPDQFGRVIATQFAFISSNSTDRNWWTQYWAHSAGPRNTFNQGQGYSAFKHLQMRFHQS